MADVRSAPNIEEALSRTPNINTLEARTYRKMVRRAMLISGIPFEVLDDNDACSIRHILEVGGKATLPKREVVDCIPDLLKEELARVFKELGSNCFSIIFDGTPAVAEVFGMVIRFLNQDHIICHRALSIRFYRDAFNKAQLASEIVRIISTEHGVDMSRVLFAICDGCVTNGAALTTVKLLQPCLIEMICISHAANVKKNVRNTKPTCHILLMAVRELELYLEHCQMNQ